MLHAILLYYTDMTIGTGWFMWQILMVFLICTTHYIHILKFINLDSDNQKGIFGVYYLVCNSFLLKCEPHSEKWTCHKQTA